MAKITVIRKPSGSQADRFPDWFLEDLIGVKFATTLPQVIMYLGAECKLGRPKGQTGRQFQSPAEYQEAHPISTSEMAHGLKEAKRKKALAWFKERFAAELKWPRGMVFLFDYHCTEYEA